MEKIRYMLSLVLLTVYLIVLGHSFVAHHHHEKSFTDNCCQEISPLQSESHMELCADSSCHHENQSQTPCHFDVRPVPGKTLDLRVATLTAFVLFEICFPEEEAITWYEQRVFVPKTPEQHTSGLRAPPVIA
ncbi:DUF6769 family protein [Mangrovibacterium lignilyticum]|uniref:DUF6769 family protein n=1 Tax=Mangrovibacterium lignilyticum TaxID=2668052 RepID=UPI0013D5A2D2|nr:DUF6769 family protein [Mangrovibacterium lignilyticum]